MIQINPEPPKLDGKLHGPVHIMIGGHWAADESTAAWLGDAMGDRSQAWFLPKKGTRREERSCGEILLREK